MRLLIDENVPDSVAEVFRRRGHDVTLVREVFPSGTPDPIIAARANESGAIVVTWNYQDFKPLSARRPRLNQNRFPRLSLITYEVREPQGVRRTEEFIELIEFEYSQCQLRPDKRLLIHIGEMYCRVER